jgi:hypothetical protein
VRFPYAKLLGESMKYMKPYLIFNVAVWLPWGLICIFDIATIQDIIGVTSVTASGIPIQPVP